MENISANRTIPKVIEERIQCFNRSKIAKCLDHFDTSRIAISRLAPAVFRIAVIREARRRATNSFVFELHFVSFATLLPSFQVNLARNYRECILYKVFTYIRRNLSYVLGTNANDAMSISRIYFCVMWCKWIEILFAYFASLFSRQGQCDYCVIIIKYVHILLIYN